MCSRGKGKASTPLTTSESAETAWTSFHLYEMVRKLFQPLFHMYYTLPSTCTICTLLFQSLDFLKFLTSIMLTKAASICLSIHPSIYLHTNYLLIISLDYKGHRLSDVSSGKKGKFVQTAF